MDQLADIDNSAFSFPIGVVADLNNLPKYAHADTPQYLKFEKSADQTFYRVSAGDNIEESDGVIVIPQVYDNLPVKEIQLLPRERML
jgi:hypothetical protein